MDKHLEERNKETRWRPKNGYVLLVICTQGQRI